MWLIGNHRIYNTAGCLYIHRVYRDETKEEARIVIVYPDHEITVLQYSNSKCVDYVYLFIKDQLRIGSDYADLTKLFDE